MEGAIGFIAGFFVMSIAIAMFPTDEVVEYRAAIEQCQQELPRNQTCEIFAKPVNKR